MEEILVSNVMSFSIIYDYEKPKYRIINESILENNFFFRISMMKYICMLFSDVWCVIHPWLSIEAFELAFQLR